MKHYVIAIDGPASAGKGTVARLVAERLKFLYVDTGAMYRAITLKALKENIPLDDETTLIKMAKETSIELIFNNNKYKVMTDGKDVSEEIRTEQVSQKTHFIASILKIREILWEMQRAYRKNYNLVMEGRDIGSIVFPDAEIKIYLDADIEERAKRRYKQLKENGHQVDIETVKKSLIERDEKDKNRTISPLKKLSESIYIDTTKMTIAQEVQQIVNIFYEMR
ncbi:MAG: (d)CMP kinase [Candidatus Omnitrophica bacterium]|jgi:cytidylate kinase|nr:(d)CMP kinase [Candidatus Omnitrophota bacterium]